MKLAYLKDLWNDEDAKGMDEPELLRYRSNLLGSDLRLTNFAGGNTSAKVELKDPLTGEPTTVLWVKGSGGDLGTMNRSGFATLYQDKLQDLKRVYKGPDREDEMVELFSLCVFNNNPRAPSIDTPLHAFLPYPHVDHLHPDWAIALAASANGPAHLERLKDTTGIRLAWLPWKRPGFELGLWLEKAVQEDPSIDGIILGSHGLFTWGSTARESYLNTLRVIDGIGVYVVQHVEREGSGLFGGKQVDQRSDAPSLVRALMPVLRGEVGPAIGHFTDQPEVVRFINSRRGKALAWQGTSCPDHFVRTKVRPLFVDWEPSGSVDNAIALTRQALADYRLDYRSYYEQHRSQSSPAMRSENPSVALVPGVGLFSFGRSKAEARITAEFYVNAIHVMEGATSMGDLPGAASAPTEQVLDNYVALPPSEAFGIEYWLLEEAKLKRMPPEKELSRKVALVLGASPGIGRATAQRLAKEGAHVAVVDLDQSAADSIAAELNATGDSERAIAAAADCKDREAVRKMLSAVIRQFGGIDILVHTAAVFIPPDAAGRISDEAWRRTFDVNVLGSVIAAEEAFEVMSEQGTSGSIVLLSSANAVVAKTGSRAYDSGKSALNHLVREMAVEFAPKVRVNAVAPASVVEGSVQFPRDRVITSLQKYGLAAEDHESTELLRTRLAEYYANRSILRRRVTPADVAEAIFLLSSDRLKVTTGQILPVDAGLSEAFLR